MKPHNNPRIATSAFRAFLATIAWIIAFTRGILTMKTTLTLRSTSSMNAALTKLALFSTLFAACGLLAADLEQGFRQPPDSARPWVWWFWLNNNVTKETITSDLEQYKAKGIGGVTVYSLGALKGRVASGPSFMSPAWRELFRHTVREADRLGLGVSVMPCAGWNAAGPWISADNACKRFVQSKLTIRGPLKFAEKLPQPQVLEKYWDVNVQAFPAQPPVTAGNPDPVRTRLLAMKSAQDSAGPTPKTPFRHLWEAPLAELPPAPGERPIVPAAVIDLTARLAPDGTLTWEVPEGEWTILRTGCTLTGQRNLCVGPGDEGWDSDPLRAAAIETHFKNTSEILLADAGDLAGKTLRSLQIDSWEIKIPNWSQTFLAEFQRFRGYDARPYLAALAGCTVGSAEITDRFLHDYRKTLGDCVAENYFGRFTTLARARNVLNQSEAGGPCYPQTMPMDFLKNLGRCDIPMGEFWQSETWGANGLILNGKQTASAAHTYGKRLAAAEAFGSFGRTWGDSPASLKPTGDQAFCEGLNWFFIFSTATQPGAGTPGVEFHAGTHFNQNTTWWKQAKPFTDYIGRCSYLLQQGLFAADVCYYNGDWTPNLVEPKHVDPALGAGYDYDACNAEVLLTRMTVRNGRIVLPDGMSYRLLVLPERKSMPIEVLQKLRDLVEAGATVVGPKPEKDSGLKNFPQCDQDVKRLADEVWGPCDGTNITEHRFGNGRVVWGKKLRDVLLSQGVLPDFEYAGGSLHDRRWPDTCALGVRAIRLDVRGVPYGGAYSTGRGPKLCNAEANPGVGRALGRGVRHGMGWTEVGAIRSARVLDEAPGGGNQVLLGNGHLPAEFRSGGTAPASRQTNPSRFGHGAEHRGGATQW